MLSNWFIQFVFAVLSHCWAHADSNCLDKMAIELVDVKLEPKRLRNTKQIHANNNNGNSNGHTAIATATVYTSNDLPFGVGVLLSDAHRI